MLVSFFLVSLHSLNTEQIGMIISTSPFVSILCMSTEALATCFLIFPSIDCFVLYRSVERLDLEQERWIQSEPMLSRRSTLGVAVLNGEIYAVGGFDGNNGLDTVEKYNLGQFSLLLLFLVFTTL